jgi:hypothetical protein
MKTKVDNIPSLVQKAFDSQEKINKNRGSLFS